MWRIHGALGVVDRDLLDLGARIQQQSSDRSEDDAHTKEERQDGLGRENWLPCLEALLAESGICPPSSAMPLSSAMRGIPVGRRTRRPPALLLLIRLLIFSETA